MPTSSAAGTVEVSPRWDSRLEIWQSEDGREALARLALPESYAGDLQDTAWHPALLDVAASLALDRPGLVPACCRELRLYHALPAALFAHVVRRQVGQGLEGDCVLCDEQGEILVELRGLLFAPLQIGKPRQHRLVWTDAARSPVPETSGDEVLVLGSGPLVEGLAKRLANSAERGAEATGRPRRRAVRLWPRRSSAMDWRGRSASCPGLAWAGPSRH